MDPRIYDKTKTDKKNVLETSVAESESRESKVFTGSRSRKKDFAGVGVRVE